MSRDDSPTSIMAIQVRLNDESNTNYADKLKEVANEICIGVISRAESGCWLL